MKSEYSEGAEFYEKHLRAFSVKRSSAEAGEVPFFGSMPELFSAFRTTTGYELQFVRAGGNTSESGAVAVLPVGAESDRVPARLILTRAEGRLPMVEPEAAAALAESLAATLSEAYRWSAALRDREAELAANGVNATETPLSGERLSQRLSMILKGASRALGCEAASLYLLDEWTTVLKMRSVWGLPEERLVEPPRLLVGALADLEALLGNAVVLNDRFLWEQWAAPEAFATSVCVPVASESSILGTLWLFSDTKPDFSDKELSVLEIVAGRIAVELERAGLLAEHRKQRAVIRRTDALTEKLQSDAAPTVQRAEGWQFAGRPDVRDALPRTFCAWHDLKGGKAALSIGTGSGLCDSRKGEGGAALCDAVKMARFLTAVDTAAETAPNAKAFLNWLKTGNSDESSRSGAKNANAKNASVTPLFRASDAGRESALFFLAILGKKERRLTVERNEECRVIPFPAESRDMEKSRHKIPDGGGLAVIRSDEKIPEKVVSETLPSILRDQAQGEAEKLLRLLACQLEKKGRCKNFTLFVVKSPERDR